MCNNPNCTSPSCKKYYEFLEALEKEMKDKYPTIETEDLRLTIQHLHRQIHPMIQVFLESCKTIGTQTSTVKTSEPVDLTKVKAIKSFDWSTFPSE